MIRGNEIQSPCNGCKERCVDCHSKCIAYGEWKEQHNERVRQEHKARKTESDYRTFKIQAALNTMRTLGIK